MKVFTHKLENKNGALLFDNAEEAAPFVKMWAERGNPGVLTEGRWEFPETDAEWERYFAQAGF